MLAFTSWGSGHLGSQQAMGLPIPSVKGVSRLGCFEFSVNPHLSPPLVLTLAKF